jgi:hypothetical protein
MPPCQAQTNRSHAGKREDDEGQKRDASEESLKKPSNNSGSTRNKNKPSLSRSFAVVSLLTAFPPFRLSAFPPFRISAFQHFSISAFQHFSISAFQYFSISVFTLSPFPFPHLP